MQSAVYYGNVWRGKTFPFMSQALFDSEGKTSLDIPAFVIERASTGNEYNQTAILTNGVFDAEKYAQVGVSGRISQKLHPSKLRVACLVLRDQRPWPDHEQSRYGSDYSSCLLILLERVRVANCLCLPAELNRSLRTVSSPSGWLSIRGISTSR